MNISMLWLVCLTNLLQYDAWSCFVVLDVKVIETSLQWVTGPVMGWLLSALASSVKLASSRGYSFCNYRLLKGFISYRNLFDFLLTLVVLKRPGFQSQKYGLLINFAQSVFEYMTTNVTAKPDTFLREANPCYTVVFHMCSCKTIAVSKKQLF